MNEFVFIILKCKVLNSSSTGSGSTPYILTAIITILLFVIGRFIDHTYKLREIRSSWYLKIILEPILKKLDSMIDDIDELFSNNLVYSRSDTISNEQKTAIFGKYDSIIRTFEVEVNSIIAVNYPVLAVKLNSLLIEFDSFKQNIDNVSQSEENQKFNFKRELFTFKAEILKTLYEPLTTQSKNTNFDENF